MRLTGRPRGVKNPKESIFRPFTYIKAQQLVRSFRLEFSRWRVTSICRKFLCQAVQSFGFLRAGKGPKLTKNKKLECFMEGNTTSFLRKLGQATMLKTYILVLYTCVCNLCNHQFWFEATEETSLPSFGENLIKS